MNILAISRFTSAFPLCGLGICPRKRAACCACIMTNSIKRCATSPELVTVRTSAMLFTFRPWPRHRRSNNGQDMGLPPKIFGSYALNVGRRDSIDRGFKFLVAVKAQTIDFIQGAHVGEGVVTLVRNLLLANQLFLRSGQFCLSQAVSRKFFHLIKESCGHLLHLLRIGAKIECK